MSKRIPAWLSDLADEYHASVTVQPIGDCGLCRCPIYGDEKVAYDDEGGLLCPSCADELGITQPTEKPEFPYGEFQNGSQWNDPDYPFSQDTDYIPRY